MAKKTISFKTKGMNRDLSVSAFNPDFSFENMNLRLSTNEGNTMMSWVNERGTLKLSVNVWLEPWNGYHSKTNTIYGIPIGTAVINHCLVLFTTLTGTSNPSAKPDYIYVFQYTNNGQVTMDGKQIYNGNLNFNPSYPLETLVYYEASNIQKVYWTDGLNQPRLINIKASNEKMERWNSTKDGSIDTFFDFVPSVNTKEVFTVTKNPSGGGLFAPGVIQYCFTYINKHSQQTNIIAVSPLFYLTHNDRGASADDKINSSFTISIDSADKNYDYIRLYSLQRTSLNSDLIVKLLDDIPVGGNVQAALFSSTLVYSEDSSLTLPRNSEGRILTATVVNGSYNVSVSGTGYANNLSLDLVGYNSDGTYGRIISLQLLVDQLFDDSLDGIQSTYFIKDYHAGFFVGQEFDIHYQELAEGLGYETWMFKAGDTFISHEEATDADPLYVIYDYADKKWYFTYSEAIESVTKTEIKEGEIIYTDNGTTGSTVDPTELLYVGGREISAYTMADKDNTLFLGNITQRNTLMTDVQKYFDKQRKNNNISISYTNSKKTLKLDHAYGIYSYTNLLKDKSQKDITTFKGGETYRFGFQLQKKTGEWLEPIFLDDLQNTLYPKASIGTSNTDEVSLVSATSTISIDNIKDNVATFDKTLFRKIRPVVVFPNIGDRSVLCQGVLNPTVFNWEDRMTNSPFAQASWFFRPYMWSSTENSESTVNIDLSQYISIDPLDLTENPDLTVSDYFKSYIQNVYVLVADVASDKIDSILSNGSLTLYHSEWQRGNDDDRDDYTENDNIECPFIGAINLGNSRYAFLSRYSWQKEVNDPDYYTGKIEGSNITGGLIYEYQNVTAVRIENVAFSFYNGMMSTSNNLLYYVKPDDGSDTYIFKFYAGGIYYQVTFSDVSSDANFSTGYELTSKDLGGNGLRFTHYQSLFTISDLPKKVNVSAPTPNITEDARNIEIQGSVQTYNNPFATVKSNPNSNTQFFVDQSIVTLNSPDIEFDTEVQTYSTEGLKLRIVGAIPITANISSHAITTSSNMLERSHNQKGNSTAYFGSGELKSNVIYTMSQGINTNAGKRLVSEYLWNDVVVREDTSKEDKITTSSMATNFLIYPWQRTGSLNNDNRSSDVASSLLKTKKEANLLYSLQSLYLNNNSGSYVSFDNMDAQMILTENAEVMNYRLPRQKPTSSEINYYPNIDKMLVNGDGYNIINSGSSYDTRDSHTITSPVSMKYKSTSHAVLGLDAPSDGTSDANKIPILPYGAIGSSSTGVYTNASPANTFWGDTAMSFSQSSIDLSTLFNNNAFNFLWLGEIYKDVTNRFGGTSEAALRANNWLVGGEAVDLTDENDNYKSTVTLDWTIGDTYYQRYDCLKTYAFTQDDPNQLVEILSFMCETHVNIDGRYDRNRGQVDNTNMNPTIFNLLNPIYSQKDNFFNYRKTDIENESELNYANQVYYSKTKESGADVDLYTNVTLGSVLELDGDKGSVNAIKRFNDNLIAFQDHAISQILYNENVQVATQTGVPIEIANSGKVQGKRYLSDTIGCSNKWSITTTPSGIYFIDNNDRSIYLFNGQLQNLSINGGMNSWSKQNIPVSSIRWTPSSYGNFTAYYDKLNQDVLFINKNIALAYSERFGGFTSFYDYGGTPYLANLDSTGIWARYADGETTLYKHNAGNYSEFFGESKPYWMTLIGNPEPQLSKVFTNLELRTTVDGDGSYDETTKKFNPYLPFDTLETWNEYQHGIATFDSQKGQMLMKHHEAVGLSSLKRKFRIWRCDIPRDNMFLSSEDEKLGITRFKVRPLDRMRNPWLYLKLRKNASTKTDADGNKLSLDRTEIHDIMMTYFS